MKKVIFFGLFLIQMISMYAVTAMHVSPETFVPGQEVEVLLEMQGGVETIAKVLVNFRHVGETQWQSESMRFDGGESMYWRTSIPASMFALDAVEYRFEFRLQSGVTEYLPVQEELSKPYVLNPMVPQGSKTDGFVLLSDESSISADDTYVLAVGFLALDSRIDYKSIKVWVGGKDVTSKTQISGLALVYREAKPEPGLQKAMVMAVVDGKPVYSDTWITQVLPGSGKRALPFTYRGAFSFASNVYGVSNSASSFGNSRDDYASWLDLYGTYGILDMQTNLYLSSLEDSNKQAVNRYTFGMKIPRLEMFFGDYSPSLSQFSLSGKNIRGLYSRYTSDYLSLLWAHGEAVRETTNEGDVTLGIAKTGTFKQEAIGAKVLFGNEKSFHLGISATRHRDIISSLNEEYYQYTNPADTTIVYTSPAQDNAVLSVDARMYIPEQSALMGLEIATSVLNTNTIPGAFSADDLDDYDLDVDIDPSDYANLFVVNKNLEPFNISKANMAWTGYFRTYFSNNLIDLRYTEVGKVFNAKGIYTQQQDSRVVSLTDQFTLGRLATISGGANYIEDNLMRHKSETNKHLNIFGQTIVRLPKLPYIKASFFDNSSSNTKNDDIIDDEYMPYERASRNISFGLGYNFIQIPYVPSQLDISYRFGNDSSERNPDSLTTEIMSDNKNSGLNFTISNRYNMLPLKTMISYSNSKNTNELSDLEYKSGSFYFRADYAIWETFIKPYFSFRNTGLSGDQDKQSYNQIAFGLESNPYKDLSISTDLGMKTYKNDADSSRDYETTAWRLHVTKRF